MGAPVRVGNLPCPYRPPATEAQRHHVLLGRSSSRGSDRSGAAPHGRLRRLQRGVPRRGPRARRLQSRRSGRRVARGRRNAGGRAADGCRCRFRWCRPHRRWKRRRTRRQNPGRRRRCRPRRPPGCCEARSRGPDPQLDQRPGASNGRGGRHTRPRGIDRQGAPSVAQPADADVGFEPHPRPRHGSTGVARWMGAGHAVRDQRHVAQPGQQHRRRHDRDKQERARRVGARPSARARSVARRHMAGDAPS